MRSGIGWHSGAVSKGLETEGGIALLSDDAEFRMFVFLGVHPPEPAVFQDARIHSGSVPSRRSPITSSVALPWPGSLSAVRPCRHCASKVVCFFVVLQQVDYWVVQCPPPPPPSTTFRTTGKLVRMVLTPHGGPQRTRNE